MSDSFSGLDVRPSPIAGRWYPGQPDHLARTVDEFIARAEVEPIQGHIVGLLAPHAGHRYSGPVAGHAFKAIQGMAVDIVALIGPSHHAYPAPVVTTGHAAYMTPLGPVPVDHAILSQLRKTVDMQTVREDPEHSLEIELPFLQRTVGEFRLVPLALLDQSWELAEHLGHALAENLAGQNALVIASSDLSHFYPQKLANRLDQHVLDAVAAYDPQAVIMAEQRGQGYACGRGAIAATMVAARLLGADKARIVGYATSGDTTQDYAQVVGYGAAVFYKTQSETP